MYRLFNLFRRDIVADLLNGRITIENFYRQLYTYLVIIVTAIFTLSLVADVAGFNGLNIVLIPVWVIVIGYFGFHPIYLIAFKTIDTATKNKLEEYIGTTWKQFFIHLAMFGGVFFLTRFLVPIRNYPFSGMLILGATILLGLYSWVDWKETKAYRRYVLAIIVVALTVGLFGSFTGNRPAHGENPMAPMHGGVKGMIQGFFHREKIHVEVSSLSKEVEVSGVEAGTRKFSVPEKQFVLLLGTNTSAEINDKIRVNGMKSGESFEVAADGKVKVKFVGPPEFLRQPIDWQELTLEIS